MFLRMVVLLFFGKPIYYYGPYQSVIIYPTAASTIKSEEKDNCDVTIYHPVCAFRNHLKTFFSDCMIKLANYVLVDAPGWLKVSDGPCPSQKIDINEY